LAGPLVIAGVVLYGMIKGVMDSKKLSEKKREEIYIQIIQNSRYHIVIFDARQVDDMGISECLRQGLLEIMHHLPGHDYLFDGNCTFGVQNIETMIKADEKIFEVSAASILAKVTRDRIMIELAALYRQYGFDNHKGSLFFQPFPEIRRQVRRIASHKLMPDNARQSLIQSTQGLISLIVNGRAIEVE